MFHHAPPEAAEELVIIHRPARSTADRISGRICIAIGLIALILIPGRMLFSLISWCFAQ